MIIKANEELFNEVKTITIEMNDFLPIIVQNDIEVTDNEYLDYLDDYEKYINKLDDWLMKVKKHIRNRKTV